ncbi:MAG TPA: SWIM zinc finger family protein [Micromonosporaceae bacterium]|jgi:hypothetical protein
MREPWSPDQVAALASDSSSIGAARGLATPAKWLAAGAADGTPASLWGLAKGSGAKPYQTCIDLDEPAYRCSCPSRKFPCKHALGLLLLWSSGRVAEADPPAWVDEWHAGRAERSAKAEARRSSAAAAPTEDQVKAAAKRSADRDERVARGVAELAQWLDDQVRGGIAALDHAGYEHWDTAAARLIDAQAPGLARRVRALAGTASSRSGWDQRLLAELGMLRLLTQAYARLAALPPALAETVRAHVGFTVPVERVLGTEPVRDIWQVIGARDESDERLTTRRTWLIGRTSGRAALVLGFAMPGQPLPVDLVVGTAVDADLYFYPGAMPLRAVVAAKHDSPELCPLPTPVVTVAQALTAYAAALAGDPWLDSWPVLIDGVLVPGSPWHLVDGDGDALPVRTRAGEPWHIVAAAAGRSAGIAAEWSPDGLLLLGAYTDAEAIRA